MKPYKRSELEKDPTIEATTSPTIQALAKAGKLAEEVFEIRCPNCNNLFFAGRLKLDGAGERPTGPRENDPGVCLVCGEFMIWHDGLMMKPTPEELKWIVNVPEAAQISHEIKTQNDAKRN